MAQVLTFPHHRTHGFPTTAPTQRHQFSPHPSWIVDLIDTLKPYQERVWNCPLVQEASTGSLSLRQMQGWLIQLYPFIETFPQWIAMNITKASDPYAREILIDNIRVEKWHAKQWVDMTEAFGVSLDELHHASILPEVEALTHYMWSINLRGTLAESLSAMTYAIEGTTHGIAQAVLQGFPKYDGRYGIRLTKRAYAWMQNHARYDETHPLEALEIIKRESPPEEIQSRVKYAAQRSMEYFFMALDACYRHFAPEDCSFHSLPASAAA
ncbi:MAG: hypothetical protein D6704_03625 [Nitrospirae bacterium]|nr:MAG: hypothetical protein D6704_03625 [Nitrospirota bacterium]